MQEAPFLGPSCLQAQLLHARRPQPACSLLPKLSMPAATALYRSGISAGAATMRKSVTPGTHHKRDAIQLEFESFLSQLPSSMGRSIQQCCPADIVVFMEEVWLPMHLGSQTKTGQHVAAPSSVEGALCNLSTVFQQHGRGQPWDCNLLTGNPIWSLTVKDWKRGYFHAAAAQGFVSTGAQELTAAKVQALLSHLHGRLSEANHFVRYAAARDGFAFSFLWQTGARGANAGPLTSHDFVTLDGRPAIPLIYPSCSLTPGTVIQVTPKRLKTCVGINKEPMFITALPADQAIVCPVQWLLLCMQTASACGHTTEPDAFIARTLAKGGRSITSEAMSTDALGQRLKVHLSHLGLYEGESMHSFRRGRSIADQAAGLPSSEIMDKLLIRSKAVYKRSYQSAGLHQSGVRRLRSALQPTSTASLSPASASASASAPVSLSTCQEFQSAMPGCSSQPLPYHGT